MGAVDAIFRYPVKSMLGERLDEAEITLRGVAGDRTHALIDIETGKIASAKNPRLWEDLLSLTGAEAVKLSDDELSERVGRRVRLTDLPPEGATLDRARPDEILAKGIEAEVGFDLSRVAAGTFFDFAPLHVITSAMGVGEPVRYRPNLLLDLPAKELALVGRTLQIGQLVLKVLVPTPRCAIPTLAHGDLPRDIEALRGPSRHNRLPVLDLGPRACVGVYAEVLTPGRISVGDKVTILPG